MEGCVDDVRREGLRGFAAPSNWFLHVCRSAFKRIEQVDKQHPCLTTGLHQTLEN